MSSNLLYWEATKTCGMIMASEMYENHSICFPNGLFITYYGLTERYMIQIIMYVREFRKQQYFIKEMEKNKNEETRK